MTPGWLKKKAAAKYGGVSEKTLSSWMAKGLRFVRLETGTLLFRPQWIDTFLEGFEVNGQKLREDLKFQLCNEIERALE